MNEVTKGTPDKQAESEIERIDNRLRPLMGQSGNVLERIEHACDRLQSAPKQPREEDCTPAMGDDMGVLERLHQKIEVLNRNVAAAQEQLCRLEELV